MADRAPALSPSDRYVVLRYLAEGGMGAVYLGKKLGAGGFEQEVVLKQLLPEFTQQPAFIDLFLREARLTATLDHANIVHTIDLVRSEDDLFIVMEYVRGGDLRTLLRRAKRRKRRFPAAAALFIAREVLSALDYAHEKIGPDGRSLELIHRDVSPSNIMVSGTGEVKLTDFGIAKASTHQSVFYRVRGKVGYMSPEQARGDAVDARSDLYSVAICLYEMLTGERLFVVATITASADEIYRQPIPRISRKRPDLPPALDSVMTRALALHPRDRFQSAADFREALRRVARHAGLLRAGVEVAGQLIEACGPVPEWHSPAVRGGPGEPADHGAPGAGTEKIKLDELGLDGVEGTGPGGVGPGTARIGPGGADGGSDAEASFDADDAAPPDTGGGTPALSPRTPATPGGRTNVGRRPPPPRAARVEVVEDDDEDIDGAWAMAVRAPPSVRVESEPRHRTPPSLPAGKELTSVMAPGGARAPAADAAPPPGDPLGDAARWRDLALGETLPANALRAPPGPERPAWPPEAGGAPAMPAPRPVGPLAPAPAPTGPPRPGATPPRGRTERLPPLGWSGAASPGAARPRFPVWVPVVGLAGVAAGVALAIGLSGPAIHPAPIGSPPRGAEPGPAAPAPAPVTIESVPPGARVLVEGGRAPCQAPCALAGLAGVTIVRVEKDGYLPWTGQVDGARSAGTRRVARLRPRPPAGSAWGRVVLHAPRPGEVLVSGAAVGHVTTEGPLDLPAGEADVAVVEPDGTTLRMRVLVRSGQTVEAHLR